MSDVFFYHLTSSPLEQVLPDLLGLCLKRHWRVCVRGPDPARLARLDDRIWLHREDGFLPHGLAGGAHDVRQPILLTTEGAVNHAQVLMLVDGARPDPSEVADYERVCLLFDGNNDDATTAAREDWKTIVAANIPAQYWAQDDGRWQKKAESTASE